MARRLAEFELGRRLRDVGALLIVPALLAGWVAVPAATATPSHPAAATNTTAWRDGRMHVDVAGSMSRSDIVSAAPLVEDYESMPLGNGHVTAMVWNADGYTAQLNRTDTWPDLRSAGRLVIPGLSSLAARSTSRLSPYNAALGMTSGGLSVTSRVLINRDVLVVTVSGADPDVEQTAEVNLWGQSPTGAFQPGPITRSPHTFASAGTAGLYETFAGKQGDVHGFVNAVSAVGRDVQAEVTSPTSAQVRFKPNPDGTFRVVVAVPSYTTGDPADTAASLIAPSLAESDTDLVETHNQYWHRFWADSHLQLESADGQAAYLENVRNMYFYLLRSSTDPAAKVPASAGGGVGNFMYAKDARDWFTEIYHFNSRLFTFANAAGNHLDLTEPYRRFYAGHLDKWKQVAAGWGKQGACVPEIAFYDGSGRSGQACGGGGFVRGITTDGLEIARTLWEQYQFTGDHDYLGQIYPFLRDVARYELSNLVKETDGKLHIHDSAALEAYVHVDDPTNELAGIRAVFPSVIEASTLLGEDPDLRGELTNALDDLTGFPRDPSRGNVVGPARVPYDTDSEGNHGNQDPALELVFPFGLVGDDDQMTDLMRQTFAARKGPLSNDWTPDPIQAARLGLGQQAATLAALSAEKFQIFPSGFSNVYPGRSAVGQASAYVEWSGTIAEATQEMSMQSYDDLIRIAPAWPTSWSGSFTLRAVGGFLVSSQVDHGEARYVGIKSTLGGSLQIRNPWPGEQVRLRTDDGQQLLTTSGKVIEADTTQGIAYVLERVAQPLSELSYSPVSGQANDGVRVLGKAQLGVGSAPARADLTVASTDITTDVLEDGDLRISVQAHNTGAVESTASTVRVEDNGGGVPVRIGPDIDLSAVPAGGSRTVSIDWDVSRTSGGRHSIHVVVNPDRVAIEADNTNNEATKLAWAGPPPAEVTADSTYAPAYGPENFIPEKAIDGDLSTFWNSTGSAGGHWIQLNLAKTAKVKSVVIHARRGLAGLVVTDVNVATALTGQPLTIRGEMSSNTAEDIAITFPEAVDADQVRVNVLAETYRGAPRTWADIAEIELYDADGNPILAGVPGPPSGVTAIADAGAVLLKWASPEGDGGAPIQHYIITPFVGAVAQTPITTPTAATSFTMAGLVPGTDYTFKVAAVNSAGIGAPSHPTETVIIKRSQSITFEPLGTIELGRGPVLLSATASSGLPVSYSVAGPCTLSHTVFVWSVTATDLGACAITASQDGNDDWLPAANVQRTLAVADTIAEKIKVHAARGVRAGAIEQVTVEVRNSNHRPADDAAVRFTVTGANTASDVVTTNSKGRASFTYRAAEAGRDVITATVGSISDSITVSVHRPNER